MGGLALSPGTPTSGLSVLHTLLPLVWRVPTRRESQWSSVFSVSVVRPLQMTPIIVHHPRPITLVDTSPCLWRFSVLPARVFVGVELPTRLGLHKPPPGSSSDSKSGMTSSSRSRFRPSSRGKPSTSSSAGVTVPWQGDRSSTGATVPGVSGDPRQTTRGDFDARPSRRPTGLPVRSLTASPSILRFVITP